MIDPSGITNYPEPKIKRVFENYNWVIDLIDGKIRVSYFEEGHFVDDILLSGDDFKDKVEQCLK